MASGTFKHFPPDFEWEYLAQMMAEPPFSFEIVTSLERPSDAPERPCSSQKTPSTACSSPQNPSPAQAKASGHEESSVPLDPKWSTPKSFIPKHPPLVTPNVEREAIWTPEKTTDGAHAIPEISPFGVLGPGVSFGSIGPESPSKAFRDLVSGNFPVEVSEADFSVPALVLPSNDVPHEELGRIDELEGRSKMVLRSITSEGPEDEETSNFRKTHFPTSCPVLQANTENTQEKEELAKITKPTAMDDVEHDSVVDFSANSSCDVLSQVPPQKRLEMESSIGKKADLRTAEEDEEMEKNDDSTIVQASLTMDQDVGMVDAANHGAVDKGEVNAMVLNDEKSAKSAMQRSASVSALQDLFKSHKRASIMERGNCANDEVSSDVGGEMLKRYKRAMKASGLRAPFKRQSNRSSKVPTAQVGATDTQTRPLAKSELVSVPRSAPRVPILAKKMKNAYDGLDAYIDAVISQGDEARRQKEKYAKKRSHEKENDSSLEEIDENGECGTSSEELDEFQPPATAQRSTQLAQLLGVQGGHVRHSNQRHRIHPPQDRQSTTKLRRNVPANPKKRRHEEKRRAKKDRHSHNSKSSHRPSSKKNTHQDHYHSSEENISDEEFELVYPDTSSDQDLEASQDFEHYY